MFNLGFFAGKCKHNDWETELTDQQLVIHIANEYLLSTNCFPIHIMTRQILENSVRVYALFGCWKLGYEMMV